MELTAGDFVPFKKLPRGKVDLPGLGGFTFVRKMSCGELLEFMAIDRGDEAKNRQSVLTLVAKCVCSGSGEPLFADDPDPLGRLTNSLEQSDVVILKDKFLELNGLSVKEPVKEGGEKKD